MRHGLAEAVEGTLPACGLAQPQQPPGLGGLLVPDLRLDSQGTAHVSPHGGWAGRGHEKIAEQIEKSSKNILFFGDFFQTVGYSAGGSCSGFGGVIIS